MQRNQTEDHAEKARRHRANRTFVLTGALARRVDELAREVFGGRLPDRRPERLWARVGLPQDSSPDVHQLLATALTHADAHRYTAAVDALEEARRLAAYSMPTIRAAKLGPEVARLTVAALRAERLEAEAQRLNADLLATSERAERARKERTQAARAAALAVRNKRSSKKAMKWVAKVRKLSKNLRSRGLTWQRASIIAEVRKREFKNNLSARVPSARQITRYCDAAGVKR